MSGNETDGAGAGMKESAPSEQAKNLSPREIIARMATRNPIYKHLGVEVLEAEPGRSVFAIALREDLTNTFGSAHGGVIFTLADLTFGFTCNALGERAVTASASIDYLAGSTAGSRLIAEAREVMRQGRNAYYDVEIRDDTGKALAIVRGRMRIVGGSVLDAL